MLNTRIPFTSLFYCQTTSLPFRSIFPNSSKNLETSRCKDILKHEIGWTSCFIDVSASAKHSRTTFGETKALYRHSSIYWERVSMPIPLDRTSHLWNEILNRLVSTFHHCGFAIFPTLSSLLHLPAVVTVPRQMARYQRVKNNLIFISYIMYFWFVFRFFLISSSAISIARHFITVNIWWQITYINSCILAMYYIVDIFIHIFLSRIIDNFWVNT
jgi:hypothetical protein